jgi:hypothetical protein
LKVVEKVQAVNVTHISNVSYVGISICQ